MPTTEDGKRTPRLGRMIRTLKLENYRGFPEYELRDLARVNLLVGPNNCGKTTVLEAVDLLVSRGDPGALVESSRRRGESVFHDDPRREMCPVRHHFHGHEAVEDSSLSVSSEDGYGKVRMRIAEREPDESDARSEVIDDPPGYLSLVIEREGDHKDVVRPLLEDGAISWPMYSWRARRSLPAGAVPSVQFITADSLHAREMSAVWDQVLLQGRESEVVATMRILQPDLDSVHFLTGNGPGRGGIVLGLQSGRSRAPIGSYGDGMRRLLAISLSLVNAAGGFLLIDEIDTGLHWKVMDELWKLIIKEATESSIQVFATTHSLDCLNGLASLLKERPDLGDAVAVQTIERVCGESVYFDAEDIITAADLSIELR